MLSLIMAAAVWGARPLENVHYWNGVLGASGEFRTYFDNTEYSSVRIPKADEITSFASDLTLYADFHVLENVTVSVGAKGAYDFGADAEGAPGPRAYLRLRGTYDGQYQHWTFGHFRDEITPLTFTMRDYDDDLAGIRARVSAGKFDARLFLARTSTVGEGRFESFAIGGRAALAPWKITTVGANLGGLHSGGFDAGTGSPPEGGRKREVFIGSLDLRQDIVAGFYLAGESAMSIARSDTFDGNRRDSAWWAGLGWQKWGIATYGRFYDLGWAFESPWGERWLRNDENVAVLHDYYGWRAGVSYTYKIGDLGALTGGVDVGVKYRGHEFDDMDYSYNIELLKFEVYL